MALVLALRNATKLSGSGFVKTAQLTPLKMFANLAAQRLSVAKPLGLLNTATPIHRSISLSAPKLAAAGGNHSALWTAERFVSLALLGVIPAAFLYPSQALDALMAISVVLHTHWGVEAMVVDYARPIVVGNIVPKLAHGGLLLLSIATLGGLFYFIYNDVGIAKSVKELWAVQGQQTK